MPPSPSKSAAKSSRRPAPTPPVKPRKLRAVESPPPAAADRQQLLALGAEFKRFTAETVKRSGGKTADPQTGALSRRRVIERPGVMLADGTRRGARRVVKLTVYLPPDRADALDDYSRRTGKAYGDLIDEALAACGVGGAVK